MLEIPFSTEISLAPDKPPPLIVNLPLPEQMMRRQEALQRICAKQGFKDLPVEVRLALTQAWLDCGRWAGEVEMLERAMDAGSSAVPVRKKRWLW